MRTGKDTVSTSPLCAQTGGRFCNTCNDTMEPKTATKRQMISTPQLRSALLSAEHMGNTQQVPLLPSRGSDGRPVGCSVL